MIQSNFHTHTCYCDGKDRPRELIETALSLGFHTLGFSSHSYNEPDASFAMSPQAAVRYREELAVCKQEYAGRISILCGIEQDYFSTEPTDAYDYVIGSVHYVRPQGEYLCVDDSPQQLADGVSRFYHGDFDALAEEYFALVSDVQRKTGADIIGHFDLLSKFADTNGYRESPRFLAAAEEAVKALIPFEKPFEINTGAMARGVRQVPYPSPALLEMIYACGGRILFSSDCHDRRFLNHAFDMAAELAYTVGFREYWELSESGLIGRELQI